MPADDPPPPPYAAGREEYDAHFEDEAALERRLRRRRAIKRLSRNARSQAFGFAVGVIASYFATALWLKWPLIAPLPAVEIGKSCNLMEPRGLHDHSESKRPKPSPSGPVLDVEGFGLNPQRFAADAKP